MFRTMELPVKLTDEEVRLKGEKIARRLKDRENLEEERKAAAKAAKEEIGELDAEIIELRDEVRERREMRDVQVSDEKDWGRKIVRTLRLDTGEVVASRPMTPAELQQHLKLVEDEQPEESEDDEDDEDESAVG